MDFWSVFYDVNAYLERGGGVLYAIYVLAFLLWFLVFERLMYFWFSAKKERQKLTQVWQKNCQSQNAHNIRLSLQYEFRHKLLVSFPLIQTLIRVTPVLGLFGTVYGMIEIFDVIAQQGTGDAKAMANGISMATLPTMTGMAIGIVGLFFSKHIENSANRQLNKFNKGLNTNATPA